MDYTVLKQNIVAILSDLGFTVDKIVPLIVLALIIYLIISKTISPIKKKLASLETFIIRLCGAIESGGDISKIELYSTNSPLNLTPKGLEIIEKIGFKKVIDNNLDYFFKFINESQPKSALDVESISIGLIRYLMTDKKSNIFKEIDDFLYNNPSFNSPEYFKAGGIYLRDKYLDKNPSLLPKEKNK